jgi:hypothetical protein
VDAPGLTACPPWLALRLFNIALSAPSSHLAVPASAGRLDDLYSFDPATMTWTLLTPADGSDPPSARDGHGLTSAEGRLYVHGGVGNTGSACGGWMHRVILHHGMVQCL